MLFTYNTLAVLGLATLARAHMAIVSPVPFGKSTLNNSPLAADGSDFPCKQRTGVYAAEGASNTMALGSTQTVSFIGSAVHGGGSCQFSVTYDQTPTKSSSFKVIHSIEGGCPMKGVTGNNGDSASQADPDTYSFTVPTSLPTGTATFAWTWFNKVGNREMYMNCAPVTITAAAGKRSAEDEELLTRNATMLMERDQTAFNALPDMFTANIGNGCGTVDSTDVLFPNAGGSVEQLGLATSSALSKPTGSAFASAPVASAPVGTNTAVSGGVFATVPASAGGTEPTSAPAAVSTPAASPVAASSPAASPAAASTPVASASTPASTGTTGSGSAIAAGTACTTEGMWNCIGGTSFQQCASGTWSVAQPLAAGTSCTAGQSMAIDIAKHKRSVRFSGEHMRRSLQNS
ncbi:lytic polysaccharide monooxygenase [Stipitochalara longipes BDJ]|nr:lytic polysaccharide monooxygenase [Stipitochalara longipes BDJ]